MLNTAFILTRALIILVDIYTYIMLATCLLSWFMPPTGKLMQFLHLCCAPVVAPFRPLSMRLAQRLNLPIDLSFLFAYFAMQIAASLLSRLLLLLL